MRREASSYRAALHAFREVTGEPADGGATRSRLLAGAGRMRTRAAFGRAAVLVIVAGVVALASSAAAWTAVGRWRTEAPRVIEGETPDSAASLIGRGEAGPAVRVIPALISVEHSTSRTEDGEQETGAYSRAHRAHFIDDAPAGALAAWNAYLASFPAGAFVPEAKFNRALCLVRLGRFADAANALRPFERGRFGGYRREEAARLLEWLAGRASVR